MYNKVKTKTYYKQFDCGCKLAFLSDAIVTRPLITCGIIYGGRAESQLLSGCLTIT